MNSENNPANIVKLTTVAPNVAMTTSQICIAAKGTINSTNNPAAGPDSPSETTLYVVINNPAAAQSAPQITVSKSGSNLTVSWPSAAGLFTIQATPSLSHVAWAALSPQPTIVQVGQTYQATVSIGDGSNFLRLER